VRASKVVDNVERSTSFAALDSRCRRRGRLLRRLSLATPHAADITDLVEFPNDIECRAQSLGDKSDEPFVFRLLYTSLRVAAWAAWTY